MIGMGRGNPDLRGLLEARYLGEGRVRWEDGEQVHGREIRELRGFPVARLQGDSGAWA